MIDMATDDLMVDLSLSDDEVKELEAAYGIKSPAEPAPVKAEPKIEKTAAKPQADQSDLMRRLEESNRRLAEERTRRMEAEKLAHERSATVAITQARAADSDLVAVSNALTKATSDIDSWKAAHKAALEAGDYDKVTEAADKLADLRAKITSLQDGKEQLEARARTARANAEAAAKSEPPKQETADPVEQFLSQFPPRAQQWFLDHPDCMPMNDRASYYQALAAHEKVLRTGVKDGSDEYFTALDEVMGFNAKEGKVDKKDVDDVVVDTKAEQPKPSAPPRVAAPVSRDTSFVSRGADGKFQVRLTREEASIADAMGISHTAYAKNKVLLQQQGRLGVAN